MKKVTVSITDQHEYELQARQRLDDLDSRSAAIRTAIEEYADWKAEYSKLEDEYEDLQARYSDREERINELEKQLARRSQLEEKIEDLPDKLRESQLSYSEKKEIAISRASPLERWKWRLSGGVPEERVRSVSLEEE
jgi:chromosome segregation ATPase